MPIYNLAIDEESQKTVVFSILKYWRTSSISGMLYKVFDGVTRTTLVLGMKGIGKTVFINYLMVRIVEKYRASHEALPDIIYIRL
eukprot:gene26149-34192_t